MRIGTWNLDNRRLTDGHHALLLNEKCDVRLLTEVHRQWVNPEGKIADFHCHLSSGIMVRGQQWAAIAKAVKQLSRSPTRTQRVRLVLSTELHTAQRFFHGEAPRLEPLGLGTTIRKRRKMQSRPY